MRNSLLILIALSFTRPCFGTLARPKYWIQARISSSNIKGTTTIKLKNHTQRPLKEIFLWLYPNRFIKPHPFLNDINHHWVYAQDFDAGWMLIHSIKGKERRIKKTQLLVLSNKERGTSLPVIYKISLYAPLFPGEIASFKIQFSVKIPNQYGHFGRIGENIILAGGWYPQLVNLTSLGWDFTSPPCISDFHLSLYIDKGYHLIINGEYFPPQAVKQKRIELDFVGVPFISLIIYPRVYISQVSYRGFKIRYFSFLPRYIKGPIPDLVRDDYPGLSFRAVKRAIDLIFSLGFRLQGTYTLNLVESKLRLVLASALFDLVLVSDRAYRIFPLERFRKFHSFQIVRAVFSNILSSIFSSRESLRHLFWVRDLIASFFLDLYVLRYYLKEEYARDILKIGGFIPAIDQIMYAPSMEFKEAYFNSIYEPLIFRDEPWHFFNLFPRGKLIYEKLVDLLGIEEFNLLVSDYFRAKEDFIKVCLRRYGRSFEWFFKQWLGPIPRVNYRLKEITKVKVGEEFLYYIEVVKEGDSWVREPLELEIVEADGRVRVLRWNGDGRRHIFKVRSKGKIERFRLDPRNRLVEDDELTVNHVKFDNRVPASWRPPLFHGFYLFLNLSEINYYAFLNFTVRRLFDLRHALDMRAIQKPRGFEGFLRYRYGFGKKRDLNFLSWFLGGAIYGLRLNPEFGNLGYKGTLLGLSLQLFYDDRISFFDPIRGSSLNLSMGYHLVFFDHGTRESHLSLGFRYFRLITPVFGHTFAFFGGAGIVLGHAPEQALPSLGGRFFLRSYESDELLGKAKIYGVAEYRITLLRHLDINLAHIAWARRLQGVIFMGLGSLSTKESFKEILEPQSFYLEVGLGLRLHLDYAGIYQNVLAFDIGFPLSRRSIWKCSPLSCQKRFPVGIHIGIDQSF